MTEQITVDVLAEALAKAMARTFNPTTDQKLQTQERPPGRPELHIKCKSPTGATFTAVVVESREFPRGRVVSLLNYVYPDWDFGYGKVALADGKTLKAVNPRTQRLTLEKHEKQQLAIATYQKDLINYGGREFDWQIASEKSEEIRKLEAQRDDLLAKSIAKLAPVYAEPTAAEVAKAAKK